MIDPATVRDDLQHADGAAMGYRRAAIIASLIGIASMLPVALLQTGIIKHLPDPPLEGFNSDKVNLSRTAFPFGVPDGTVALLSLAANLPLAATGGADRARNRPWLPLIATTKAAVDAAAAAWYFYQMPARDKAWCAYCITGALANFAVLALLLPEGRTALRSLRRDA